MGRETIRNTGEAVHNFCHRSRHVGEMSVKVRKSPAIQGSCKIPSLQEILEPRPAGNTKMKSHGGEVSARGSEQKYQLAEEQQRQAGRPKRPTQRWNIFDRGFDIGHFRMCRFVCRSAQREDLDLQTQPFRSQNLIQDERL